MHNLNIEALERDIEQYKADIALASSLEVLLRNRHFVEVILKGYCKDEAVNLVLMKAKAENQTPDKQADIIRQLDSIGTLNEYLEIIKKRGEIAKMSHKDAQDTLERVVTEIN